VVRIAWLVAVVGCSFRPGAGVGDASEVTDGAGDGAADGSLDGSPADAGPPDAFACAATGLTCAGPATAVTCNGGCWSSCSGAATETVAAAACVAWGGHLAPVHSQGNQDCVALTLFPNQASWIGFHQAASGQVGENWSWSDGTSSSFTSWSTGQPSDGDGVEDGTEQCAYMSTSTRWQDAACTGSYKFSCRHD